MKKPYRILRERSLNIKDYNQLIDILEDLSKDIRKNGSAIEMTKLMYLDDMYKSSKRIKYLSLIMSIASTLLATIAIITSFT